MSSSAPTVSVVIPVYGVEEWLSECLDSVLAQTLSDIEVCCVDDASPDGCPAILDEYAARDPRVRVLHLTENRGQGYARNRGIIMARGKWVYLLDSDDMIVPDALERAVAHAEANELDLLIFNLKIIYESAELERQMSLDAPGHHGTYEGVYSGPDLFESFMDQGDWHCYVQCQLLRREYLRESGVWFVDASSHEDEDFSFRVLLLAKRAGYLPDRLFVRRYRDGSVMTSAPHPKRFYGYFICYLSMDRFMSERGFRTHNAEVNLARIYEKLTRLYRQLSGTCDLESWFKRPHELALYRFFASSQKAYLHYGLLSDELIERARNAKKLYLYGAGIIARNTFEGLVRAGVVVEGFIVTKAEGNPTALLGRPVRELSSFAEPPEGAVVVLAMSDGYAREAGAALDAAGWTWYSRRYGTMGA